MALTDFRLALNQVATERGISVESVLESIKSALISAYRKDIKEAGGESEFEDSEITVVLDGDTGEVQLFRDDKDVTPSGFGRIAAQTAKQVILQKIRETEKDVIMDEFKSKIGTLINATIFRNENRLITVDLGKSHAHGILPQSEQVQNEVYSLNQKLKVLIKDVRDSTRGTDIIVSRTDPQFIVELFKQEVPEIASGVVKIEAIAREPGSRTKMAVSTLDSKIDPVGSCVGQKGVRVQAIISEVFGEKIDIILYSTSDEKFIASSLAPAKVTEVVLDIENRVATVSVPEDQQSLAIGREGQNARLANKLTKWKIDIKGVKGVFDSVLEDTKFISAEDKIVGVWDKVAAKARQDIKAQDDAKVAALQEAQATEEATVEEVKVEEVTSDEQVVPSDDLTKDNE